MLDSVYLEEAGLSLLILFSSLCCSLPLPPSLNTSIPLSFHFSQPPQVKCLYSINFTSSLFLHHDVAVPYYKFTYSNEAK